MKSLYIVINDDSSVIGSISIVIDVVGVSSYVDVGSSGVVTGGTSVVSLVLSGVGSTGFFLEHDDAIKTPDINNDANNILFIFIINTPLCIKKIYFNYNIYII